jgi:hypothetical protein
MSPADARSAHAARSRPRRRERLGDVLGTIVGVEVQPGQHDHAEVGEPASQGRPRCDCPAPAARTGTVAQSTGTHGMIWYRHSLWGRRASVAIFAAFWPLLSFTRGTASMTQRQLSNSVCTGCPLASSLLRCSAEVGGHHGSRLVIESVGRKARRSDAECCPTVADACRSRGCGLRRARRRGGTRFPIDLVDTARRVVTHVAPTPARQWSAFGMTDAAFNTALAATEPSAPFFRRPWFFERLR